MLLKDLNLFNFKNFAECQVSDFSQKVNAFIGPNGSGKTNILDSIYLLCFTKSAFNSIDAQLILHGERNFMVTGSFSSEENNSFISIGYQEGQKKIIKANKVPYSKISDHIGRYPAVLISPYDQEMIHLGSEVRRKFFDAIISQYDRVYLEHLIKYNKALKHRNNLLQQFFEGNYFDEILITPFNNQIYESGMYIHERRKSFLIEFTDLFNTWLSRITEDELKIKLEYQSQVNSESFKAHLFKSVKIDISAKRTTVGTHKDDYTFLLNGEFPLKKFGSQGQQKSCIMAIKMAQYILLKEKTGSYPLLLLDDILDKLDDIKIEALVQLISGENTGQVFVTDANINRIQTLFSTIEDIRFFKVKHGKLSD